LGGHLTIHDVSAYVYTGMRSERYKNFKVQGFPFGGVQYFLKFLTLNVSNLHEIIVCFDSKTDNKKLLEGYKGNRGPVDYEVQAQLEFLYKSLLRCNIPAYKEEGFEADDLIFSSVEQNRDTSAKISLYSADYDICHNVDHNVYFEAINSRVNNVSPNNFVNSVVRGQDIMLNTISANKVFCGDSSDRIKPFNSRKYTGMQLYKMFCDKLRGIQNLTIASTRDPRMISTFIVQMAGDFTSEEIAELVNRIKVVYPTYCDKHKFVGLSQSKFDLDELAKLLTLCNDDPGLKQISKKRVNISDEEKEIFRKMGRDLQSGVYAADRGLQVDTTKPIVNSEVVTMREFSL
jgi:hypothetical protein